MHIDIKVARKVLATVDAGLCKGQGIPEPGKMCVEAAVNYALGLPHGDEPSCVAPALRRLKIRLNDSAWSSDQARAAGMRRLALIQLGSAGHLDEKEFAKRCVRLAIQKSVPEALRKAASVCKDDEKKEAMLKAAIACEHDPTHENALQALGAADIAYAAYAAAYAAYAAASAAASAAAVADIAYAASAAAVADIAYAAYAAGAAAYAAYAAADADAADIAGAADARDTSLASFAEGVVQILIEMKVPGVQWLPLTEVQPYFGRSA